MTYVKCGGALRALKFQLFLAVLHLQAMKFITCLLALLPVVTCQLQIPLSGTDSAHASVVESISDYALNSLSMQERELLLLKLWEGHDVIRLMEMMGHGAGFDEKRTVQLFGEPGLTR